ncbi:GNAT family N-acetyltransferase [Frankia sp. CiP3]|uniref:GNAT family N-acetyltransferase n=1 Tax=Frankia sp. CiP3 TaxID=2880971 RepID=UPI001EF45003|nr:GNAT family N-acetyltransferase [Frankia sp. CiP3]
MSNPSSISVADYRPSPALDAELAELAYASVRGWPDQRPITPALVRSRLRAAGDAPPTSLAFHRDNAGRLKAAAALRWPSRSHAVGRIWGPIVHPTAQRRGLGRALLDELGARTAGVDGRVTTAEIPGTRTTAAPSSKQPDGRRPEPRPCCGATSHWPHQPTHVYGSGNPSRANDSTTSSPNNTSTPTQERITTPHKKRWPDGPQTNASPRQA